MADILLDFSGWLKDQHRPPVRPPRPAHQLRLRQNAAHHRLRQGLRPRRRRYLWDADGNKYLDLLTGWGVFALGRNHPKIRAVLQQVIDADLPNLVRMDCAILAGLVAEKLTAHTSAAASPASSSPTPAPKPSKAPSSSPAASPAARKSSTATTPSTASPPARSPSTAPTSSRERFGEFTPGTVKVPFNDLPALEQALAAQRRRRVHRRARPGKNLRSRRRTATSPKPSASARPPARCSSSMKSSAASAAPANGSATSTSTASSPTSSASPRPSPAASSPSARSSPAPRS